MTPQELRARLWQGPPDDPAGLVQSVVTDVKPTDYTGFLPLARALVAVNLPVDLTPALDAHPWSIDLCILALDQATGTAGEHAALDALAACVTRQDRRWGALAWAAFQRGATDLVAQARDDVHDGSETAEADRMALAEIAILSDQDTAIPPGPGHDRLTLLRIWRTQGGGALTRALDLGAAALPADPALWSWLIDALIQERDLASARRAAQHARQRLPAAAMIDIDARLALEAEDPTAARRALTPILRQPPSERSASALALCARLLLAEEAHDPVVPSQALALTCAALRLFPRHGHLHWLAAEAAQRVGDWDALIAQPQGDPWVDLRHALTLGRPDLALTRADTIAAHTPDASTRLALRRAEAHLRLGQLDAAQAALPVDSASIPARADTAYWQAEIALARRQAKVALDALQPSLKACPTRMGLLLQAARAAFLLGDGVAAQNHLARFNHLKAQQLGRAPPQDLRDRIAADLAHHGTAPAHPAGAALALLSPPVHSATQASIPLILWHFWQGSVPGPGRRSLHAWAAQHPDHDQRLLTPEAAQDWLTRHDPTLATAFARHTQPALRADILRAALMRHAGGIYADLDEYPRAPVTPWLADARAVLVLEEGHNTIANNFLAAEPGLPIFKDLCTTIADNLDQTDIPYPWWDTGPAPLTVATQAHRALPGLRLLTQAEYDAVVATNLPFPHKTGPDHWR